MKDKHKPLTIARQKELIFINRVLASLVVILALTSGFLLALREEWIKSASPKVVPIPATTIATGSGALAVPAPSQTSLTQLMQSARYDRVLDAKPITQMALFKLLWSAQGKITSWGERTVPSYKSAYPISLTVLVRQVEKTSPGWYRFNAEDQKLDPLLSVPKEILFPETIPGLIQAPIVIIASVPNGFDKDGLTWNEAGGIAQNILLATAQERLATFLLPALSLPQTFISQIQQPQETILWLMPIGQSKMQAEQMKGAQ